MTDKYLISHLRNMTQVAGKFAFLKPDEELLIWYGIVVSYTTLSEPVSVCELPELITSNCYTL